MTLEAEHPEMAATFSATMLRQLSRHTALSREEVEPKRTCQTSNPVEYVTAIDLNNQSDPAPAPSPQTHASSLPRVMSHNLETSTSGAGLEPGVRKRIIRADLPNDQTITVAAFPKRTIRETLFKKCTPEGCRQSCAGSSSSIRWQAQGNFSINYNRCK